MLIQKQLLYVRRLHLGFTAIHYFMISFYRQDPGGEMSCWDHLHGGTVGSGEPRVKIMWPKSYNEGAIKYITYLYRSCEFNLSFNYERKLRLVTSW